MGSIPNTVFNIIIILVINILLVMTLQLKILKTLIYESVIIQSNIHLTKRCSKILKFTGVLFDK